MPAYVVDTNVASVANNKGDCPQADDACVLACTKKLKECMDILKGEVDGAIVIDEGGEIFEEYKNHFSFAGQPGLGDLFFKELFNRQATAACERVEITKDNGWGYKEFPHISELKGFDRSDRKFVAVALTSKNKPKILNAVDSDWYHFEKALRKEGLDIVQLCPNCLKGK